MGKLATSMGIELTFMPIMFDYMMQYNSKFSDDAEEVIPASNDLCRAMAYCLRQSLTWRKIPFNKCSKDPDCVEISTKPYTTHATLFRAVHKIWNEAEKHDLQPTSEYYNGGGAHIHVGNPYPDTSKKHHDFKRRMTVFVAQNPWLSWAFIGLTDDENAEPLSKSLVIGREIKTIEQLQRDLIYHSKTLHEPSIWGNKGRRHDHIANIEYSRIDYTRTKLALHRARRNERKVSQLNDIQVNDYKEYVLRSTDYGCNGTLEFRAFEMPDTEEKLQQYVYLVDAIVTHVMVQKYTEIESDTIFNTDDLVKMPYSKRKAGFHGMLRLLGFDPADWRDETVHMAFHYRHRRPKLKLKPKFQAQAPAGVTPSTITPLSVYHDYIRAVQRETLMSMMAASPMAGCSAQYFLQGFITEESNEQT